MGYRGYMHIGTSAPLDSSNDVCLGKLFGYVDDKNCDKLQVLPVIAFALEYGMQHQFKIDDSCGYTHEIWTMDDITQSPHYTPYTKIIADLCDQHNEMTLILPKYMMIPFLIAYYNDRQTYYITHNPLPIITSFDMEAVAKLTAYFELSAYPLFGDFEDIIIYWE